MLNKILIHWILKKMLDGLDSSIFLNVLIGFNSLTFLSYNGLIRWIKWMMVKLIQLSLNGKV